MKKILILMFALVLVLVGVGCNKNPDKPDKPVEEEIDYAKVNDVVDTIDYLASKGEELDFSKDVVIEDIKRVEDTYASLNDSEKKLVTNYEDFNQVKSLYEAYKKAQEEIEAELAKKKKALAEAVALVKKNIPNICGTKNLDLPTKYVSEDGIEVFIGYTTSDNKTITTKGVVTQPRGSNQLRVKLTAVVRCENLKERIEKEVKVVPLAFEKLPAKPVFAYYYSKQQKLNEIESKTIDVINLSFGDITSDGNIGLNSLNTEVVLQERKNGKRVVFSVQTKEGFRKWTKTAEARETLANNFVKAVEEYHFDGCDIDWEYPEGANEPANYTAFVKLLKQKLNAKNKDYILTSAVYGGRASQHYNIKESCKYLDYVHLMTYDLNSSEITSHLTSLGGSSYGPYSVKGTVDHYVGAGVPKDKLVVGAAFYGKVYEISKDSVGFNGAKPISKPYSVDYSVIKSTYLSKIGKGGNLKVERKWDSGANAAYLEVTELNNDNTVKAKKFVTYDDTESVKLKAEYVWANDLGGIMFWELGGSDRVYNDLVESINSVFSKH